MHQEVSLRISSVVSKVLGAGEILTLSLSKGPIGAESKDLTLAPLAGLLFVRLRYATANSLGCSQSARQKG